MTSARRRADGLLLPVDTLSALEHVGHEAGVAWRDFVKAPSPR